MYAAADAVTAAVAVVAAFKHTRKITVCNIPKKKSAYECVPHIVVNVFIVY